jgi:putative transposase
MYLTRKFHIEGTERLRRLSRSSADLWNRVCKWYWRAVDLQDHWPGKTAMRRWHCSGSQKTRPRLLLEAGPFYV